MWAGLEWHVSAAGKYFKAMVTDEPIADLGLACSLSAPERAERALSFEQLFADAEGVTELPDGYAVKFPNGDAWITDAVALILAERHCCPFFDFSLHFEPNEGPIWLHIVGPGTVKALVREQLIPAHLLPAG